MDISIRMRTLHDYLELFQIWRISPDLSLRTIDDSADGFKRFLNRNPRSNFVICKDSLIIASIMAGNDDTRGYSYHTFVLPEYKKQGFGQRLVQTATRALEEEGMAIQFS